MHMAPGHGDFGMHMDRDVAVAGAAVEKWHKGINMLCSKLP